MTSGRHPGAQDAAHRKRRTERIELRFLGLLRACQARPLRRSAVTIARNPPAQ